MYTYSQSDLHVESRSTVGRTVRCLSAAPIAFLYGGAPSFLGRLGAATRSNYVVEYCD